MTVTPSKRPARFRLLDVALDLGFRHAGIMLERERGDRLARFVAAADAGEGHHRADIGAPARQLRRFGGGVERLALQANGGSVAVMALMLARRRQRHERYPPVIGGKNAISRGACRSAPAR